MEQSKEKQFIFDLNEKILQLNNLIETGIDLAKFENQNVLYEMALARMVSLTNSSSALISVTNGNKNQPEEQITFPPGIPAENILNRNYKIESSFEFRNNLYRFVLSEKETRKGIAAFNELDQMLLDAISRQIRTAIENNFLLKESLEKERIEKETAAGSFHSAADNTR